MIWFILWVVIGFIASSAMTYLDWESGHDITIEMVLCTIIGSLLGVVTLLFFISYTIKFNTVLFKGKNK